MTTQDWSEKIIVVDLADDPELTEQLTELTERLQSEPKDVILNFVGVNFLNSSNISRLLKLRKQLLASENRFRLCGIAIQVWGVFLLTGLDSLFEVSEDTALALASLQINN